MPAPEPSRVSAVVLAFARPETTRTVLDRLEALDEITEVVVADGGDLGIADEAGRRGGKVRAIGTGDVGVRGRNLAARETTGEYLLMVDDDSFPLPGTVDLLLTALRSGPRVGAVGGFINNVALDGSPLPGQRSFGSFDWWLRAGREGDAPPEGFPAFFFPEGGVLFRREAFLEAGGFFEPYFFGNAELDLTTRLVAHGWEVRYQPAAVFYHLRPGPGAANPHDFQLRMRVRNLLWYFWLRFPPALAARRIPAYLAFDLAEAVARGVPGAFAAGVADAWRGREDLRQYRDPLPRDVLRRAELNRGRRHVAWIVGQARRVSGL